MSYLEPPSEEACSSDQFRGQNERQMLRVVVDEVSPPLLISRSAIVDRCQRRCYDPWRPNSDDRPGTVESATGRREIDGDHPTFQLFPLPLEGDGSSDLVIKVSRRCWSYTTAWLG